ncbi:MAG TPA: hypothetical protein VGB50_03465 [Flavobacterium sp.]|jgi:hypothetical protein
MTTFSPTNEQTSNRRLFALIVLVVLSSMGMFGQEVRNEISVPVTVTVLADAGSDVSSEMALVSWFMAEKQTAGIKAAGTTSTNNISKKQFINCGMVPNRILSKAFLKKAVSRDNTIA